jgi:hypothetical protein
MRAVSPLLLSAGVGLLIAVLAAASPLTICVLAVTPLLFTFAGRGLPADERRVLYGVLGVAIAARLALIVVMFLAALPRLNDLSIGGLAGDESYNLARAIRARDIVLGFANGKYDYFVVTDEYGRTAYVWLLGWIQVIFGPTPYSMRLVNALMFLTGATLLYRQARIAFGPIPAIAGLTVLLFIPSLLFSSVSLLKESLYFLATSLAIVTFVQAVRILRPRDVLVAAVVVAGSVWLLNDLRRSAAVLTLAGLGLGWLLYWVVGIRWRMAAVAALIFAGVTITALQPALRQRVVDNVLVAAKMHAGHVFTVGHAYKLMDEGFYIQPEMGPVWDVTMTEEQALRFLIRAAASFVATPLPWEMASRSELVFLPEHLVWYLLVFLLPAGLIAGWKRDPLFTAVLIGYAIPTAVAVALTNGNVGTLLRMRGLVVPYLLWLSTLGALALTEAVIRSRTGRRPSLDRRLAVEGPVL